jgi:hypothetical protein
MPSTPQPPDPAKKKPEPAEDVRIPPDVLELRALMDIVRKRAKKAVRRKTTYGDSSADLDRHEPHPFDE